MISHQIDYNLINQEENNFIKLHFVKKEVKQ